jgi:nucleoside phosphorylase
VEVIFLLLNRLLRSRTQDRPVHYDVVGMPGEHSPSEVDIAFIIALDAEFRVLRDKAGATWRPVINASYGNEDFHFYISKTDGAQYGCIACLVDDMGTGHAGDITHRALTWKPRFVLNVGIAASLKPSDLRLGDVVVVDSAIDYAAKGKIADTDDGVHVARGGEYYKVDPRLTRSIKHFEFSEKDAFDAWQIRCKHRALKMLRQETCEQLVSSGILRSSPNIVKCDLASGPVVAASEDFGTWIQSGNRNVKALEMEAAGFLRAIASHPTSAKALVIRGISDFGNKEKTALDQVNDGAIRELAMHNALDLVWTIAETGRLDIPTPQDKRMNGSAELEDLKAGVRDLHTSVAQLATAALAHARMSGHHDLAKWCRQEIDGYIGTSVPDYRIWPVNSKAHLHNAVTDVKNLPVPIRNIMFSIDTDRKVPADIRANLIKMAERMEVYEVRFGLAEIENHARNESIRAPWPDDVMSFLMPYISDMQALYVWQSVPGTLFSRVLNIVRSRIFDYVYPENKP